MLESAAAALLRQRVVAPVGRELAGHHSARRGPYRLLYRIDDETQTIWVHRVDHRGDVYRQPVNRPFATVILNEVVKPQF
jgi:mRNA-degrading endonuclease RelE of RelBE toxin-antitoxin system